jgi:hypothetical protein
MERTPLRPRGEYPFKPARIGVVAVLVSVVVHALLLVIWRVEGWLPHYAPRTSDLIVLPEDLRPPRGVQAPYYASRDRLLKGDQRPKATSQAPTPGVALLPAPSIPEPVLVDTTPIPPTPGPVPRIGAWLGDGRLWVQPLPLPPQELAQKLSRTNAEIADSVVTAMVQAYMDSVAMEPGADHVKLPDWTTEAHGLKFGLDSKNIYIAGLKIPAAILALIPLQGANESKAFDRTDQLLADLRQAAVRAGNAAQFKDAIRDLRKQRAEADAFRKAQMTPPDSIQKTDTTDDERLVIPIPRKN